MHSHRRLMVELRSAMLAPMDGKIPLCCLRQAQPGNSKIKRHVLTSPAVVEALEEPMELCNAPSTAVEVVAPSCRWCWYCIYHVKPCSCVALVQRQLLHLCPFCLNGVLNNTLRPCSVWGIPRGHCTTATHYYYCFLLSALCCVGGWLCRACSTCSNALCAAQTNLDVGFPNYRSRCGPSRPNLSTSAGVMRWNNICFSRTLCHSPCDFAESIFATLIPHCASCLPDPSGVVNVVPP